MPLNVKVMHFSLVCLQVEYETFFMAQNQSIHCYRLIFTSLTVCLYVLGARGNSAEAGEGKCGRQP